MTPRCIISFSRIARSFLLLVVACSSEDAGRVRRDYAPCNGEPGACGETVRMGGAVDGCIDTCPDAMFCSGNACWGAIVSAPANEMDELRSPLVPVIR